MDSPTYVGSETDSILLHWKFTQHDLLAGFDTEDTESDLDTSNTLWREEFKRRLAQENQFLAEIRARRKASIEATPSPSAGTLPSMQPDDVAAAAATGDVTSSKDSPASAQNGDEKKDDEDDEEIREFYNNVRHVHSDSPGHHNACLSSAWFC